MLSNECFQEFTTMLLNDWNNLDRIKKKGGDKRRKEREKENLKINKAQ